MFQFTPVNTQTSSPYTGYPGVPSTAAYGQQFPSEPAYPQQQLAPSNPRDKYLSALAAAKAAEAEFLAAEAVQREEDTLRRRLEEIQLLKRRDELTRSAPAPSYQQSYSEPEDRLSVLRRQVQDEERRRAETARHEEHRQRKAMREKAAAAKKAEEEETARALLRRRHQLEVMRGSLSRHHQDQPKIVKFVLGPSEEEQLQAAGTCCAARRPQAAKKPVERDSASPLNLVEFLQAISGATPTTAQESARPRCAHKPAQQESPAPFDLGDFFKAISGAQASDARPAQPAQKPAQPDSHPLGGLGDLLKAITGDGVSQQLAQAGPQGLEQLFKLFTQEPETAAAPPAPRQEGEGVENVLQNLFGQFGLATQQQPQPQASSSGSKKPEAAAAPAAPRREGEGLENVLQHLFGQLGLATQQQPQAQASSSGSKSSVPVAQVNKPQCVPAPSVQPSAPTSLKEQLETRLYSDESTEIRDTIQAIIASLNDSHSPSSAPAPATQSTAASASSSSAKGKSKAAVETPTSPTGIDVASSLDTVRNIEAAFTALESDFVFPPHLDFVSPTTSPSPSPASSDSELSSTSRLAFTAANQPIRFYEQSLSTLVEHLDGIESFGNDELRNRRKEVVARVEKAIEELESEVEGRWRSKVNKEKRASVEIEIVNTLVKDEVEPVHVEAPVVVESPAELAEETVTADEPSAVEQLTTPVAFEETTDESAVEETVGALIDHADVAESESAASSYPPTTTASVATLLPYDVEPTPSPEGETEAVDTFLLPSQSEPVVGKRVKKSDDHDTNSDWSEVEA